jgi:hypothetical protein
MTPFLSRPHRAAFLLVSLHSAYSNIYAYIHRILPFIRRMIHHLPPLDLVNFHKTQIFDENLCI